MRVALLVVSAWLLGAHAAVAGESGGFWRSCPGERKAIPNGPGLVPGVSWDGWRMFLGADWSAQQQERPQWFEPATIADAARAASALGGSGMTEDLMAEGTWDAGGLRDIDPATDVPADDSEAYARAADLFHRQQWLEALQAFDPLSHRTSPLRAAAAYSAARSAIDGGQVGGGIDRIAALLADPADALMYSAAHHLLGTMAYHTGALPLFAARLAEISHLLMAPARRRCGDPVLMALSLSASDDLSHIVEFAFPDGDYQSGDFSVSRQNVFTVVGRLDPVIDLVRAMAVPSPYAGLIWTEPFLPQQVRVPGSPPGDQDALLSQTGYARSVLLHARERAVATGNPLWAYAVARLSTDPVDLPLLASAERAAAAAGEDEDDRHVLAAWLRAQRIRILLMSGRIGDAATLLDGGVLDIARQRGGAGYIRTEPLNLVADGGMRLLIATGRPVAARSWAPGLRGLQDNDSADHDDAASALTWDQLLAGGLVSGGRSNKMPEDVASVLDLLPADRLLALGRTPGLALSWRRPMLGAAWIRFHALGREDAFEGMFADIRTAFPETAAYLDAVQASWLPLLRQRRVTRMLLALPGLSPRVLWNRDVPKYIRYGDIDPNLFKIDTQDPDDGNWWCPVDPARARWDAFTETTRYLTDDWYPDPASLQWEAAGPAGQPGSIDRIAAAWLHARPLTRDLDGSELDALSHVPSGPARLAGEAVRWARWSNPVTRWLGLDRDLPETLHLAVRATRYGCRSAGALGPVSRAAWTALHETFPHSDWARQTPYWFDPRPGPVPDPDQGMGP